MSRPRIRTIKPDLWHDEKVGQLDRDERLFFVALITLADDDGRFRALPAAILGHAYPYDEDVNASQIRTWLAYLDHAGLITLYEHDGVTYGAIPTWHDHQRINRPTPSTLPPPPAAPAKLEAVA